VRKWDAGLVYLILSGVMTLADSAMFVALTVYYVTIVGMNPLQLVLVGTVLEATILLFELPTGVVADTYSRRLSVVLGMFILGVAWLIEGSIALFATILLAEAVRGVGWTFLSGALQAWLADEVGDATVGPTLIRASQVDRTASLAGIALGAAIGSWQPNWPVLLGGALYLMLGMFLVLVMPERGFTPAPHADRNPLRAMRQTLAAGSQAVRGRPLVISLLLATMTYGAASEGFDRLWEAFLLLDITLPGLGGLKPIVWIALVTATGSLVGLGVTHALRHRLNTATQRPTLSARLLVGLIAATALVTLGIATVNTFAAAFVLLVARGTLLSIAGPLHDTWLIQNVPPRVRATVISMAGLSNAFGQTVGGPGVGALGNARGIRAALAASALLLLPLVGVFAHAARHPALDDRPPTTDHQVTAGDGTMV